MIIFSNSLLLNTIKQNNLVFLLKETDLLMEVSRPI